jgi:hypothetical protein
MSLKKVKVINLETKAAVDGDINYIEGDIIGIQLPHIPFNNGSIVRCVFSEKRQIDTKILGIRKNMIYVYNPPIQEEEKGRKYPRISVKIPAFISLIPLTKDNLHSAFKVTVLDLSIDGFKFRSKKQFGMQEYYFYPKLLKDQVIGIKIKILNEEKGIFDWDYGCKTIKIDEKHLMVLRKYIIQQQLAVEIRKLDILMQREPN